MIDRRFSWPGALIGLWAANSPRPCWHFRIIAFRLLHTLSHPLWHWNTFAFYTCLLSHFIPARLWVESCPRRLRTCASLWPCTFCSDRWRSGRSSRLTFAIASLKLHVFPLILTLTHNINANAHRKPKPNRLRYAVVHCGNSHTASFAQQISRMRS